jgi:hypothetical protein
MPYRTIQLGAHRRIIARLVIELLRELTASDCGAKHLDAEDILLLAAAALGHLDGVPVSAHKASLHTGIPRSTCTRRLDQLVACGAFYRVGTHYHVTDTFWNSDSSIDRIDRVARAIKRAARELSKLDT